MNKRNKVLIITGGNVDYNWTHTWLKNRCFDYVIAADRGLIHAHRLEIPVDFILGDYDSVDEKILEDYKKKTQVVTYPMEKNYTDTHIAILKAIESNAEDIAILGATGSRYDHAMTNIFNMKLALDQHIRCAIYDPNNKIYLADESFEIMKNQQYGHFVSFVPMTDEVIISLKGVKYPLDHYELRQGLSICQSNEIVMDKAEVLLEKGCVVVFETLD